MIPAPGQPPPVIVVQKRSGWGCFAIGCVVVVVLLLIGGAIVASLGYFAYSKVSKLTSNQPAAIPTFDGGDAMYQEASKKLDAFKQDAEAHRPSRLELTADEINTLIAHNPDYSGAQLHLFVRLHDDAANVQLSLPTSMLPVSIFPGRYLNAEADFTPSLDSSRNLNVNLHELKIAAEAVPPDQLAPLQMQVNTAINLQVQRSSDAEEFLSHANSVEIRDGKLIISTQ